MRRLLNIKSNKSLTRSPWFGLATALTVMSSQSQPKSVAVIGGGAAGLAALSVLRHSCQPTAFERSPDLVGGVWNYREPAGEGPMYGQLRTNLPKEIMAYPDWGWREPQASFVSHTSVLQYLHSYCYGQGLEKYIRFGQEVVSVRPSRPVEKVEANAPAWIVETRQYGAEEFDAVIVASGHFAKPLVPQLPGCESLPPGLLSHSCTYRRAEDFQDKVVALLGAGSSGQDIALELATTARQVYLCHRGPRLVTELPANLSQLGPILGFHRSEAGGGDVKYGITASSGHGEDESIVKVQIDHVMFCTGYDYDFPFLSKELAAMTLPSHVPRLYQHVVHTSLPGLYFLGLCTHIVPFPQFYLQAKLIEAFLLHRLQLPPDAEAASLRDEAQKLARGIAPRHLHTLGDEQWDYNDQLADLASGDRLPLVTRLIYDHVRLERKLRLPSYKRWRYRITGADSFQKWLTD